MATKSYDTIDYRLRTGKFVERKMIQESFQRLLYFDKLDKYKYVGFGSLYFVDFKLFYKELGITDMISIEYELDKSKQMRFEFNKPYKFINMIYKKSSDAILDINFNKRSIVWLDYDGNLDKYMFNDVQALIDNLMSGSIFLISLNTSINKNKNNELVCYLRKIKSDIQKNQSIIKGTELYKSNQILINDIQMYTKKINENLINRHELRKIIKNIKCNLDEYLHYAIINEMSVLEIHKINDVLEKLINLLEDHKSAIEKDVRVDRFVDEYNGYLTRLEYKEKDLVNKKSHIVIKEMFDKQIFEAIDKINSSKSDSDKLVYKQLYYFIYKDNAMMMTLGGIIYKKSEEDNYNKAEFQELNYIRNGDDPFHIETPAVTKKEMAYFDNEDALSLNEEIASAISSSEGDLCKERIKYNKLNRYLPYFSSVDNI